MSDLPPQARICVLKKAYPEQEYGFDLHAEKLRGQFVGNVDEESPAGLSGLKRGDRILAVNGHPVSQQNHKEVVRKIQDHPLECKFVVIDEAGYLWYTSRKMSVPVTSFLNLSNDQDLQSKPVKSVIISEDKVSVHSDGLMDAPKSDQPDSTITVQPLATSLSLDTDVGLNDQKVDFGSDEIAKVTDVEYLTDESSVFVEDPVVISLDREITSEKAFGEENIPMMDMESVEQKFDGSHVDERDTENIEHSKREELPRLCKLYRSAESQEYGFNLHAEKNKGHFIGKIDADSPADLAGLVEGYRIVGVNNTLVYVKTPHKEVVALIKQNPMNTNLLIVSPQLDAIHTAEQKPFSFQHAEIVDGSRKKFAASSVDGIPLFNADKTEISNGRFHLDNQVETIPSVDLNKERVEILPVRESNGHVILNEEKPRHAAPYKISANGKGYIPPIFFGTNF
uniref:PDZ domain-containing protein n=1 Tax=Romanomermis culicivorax TaxID=13658 RepID=A0A915IC70_ROMCU